MKKSILIVTILLFISSSLKAQMTLAHTYGSNQLYQSQVVDLSNSGKKIAILWSGAGYNQADTIFYYNLDYSFWKMIPCPAIPGYSGQFQFGPTASAAGYVCYSSETLFNTDTFLEVAVQYQNAFGVGKVYIINENGILVDSTSGNLYGDFLVHATGPTTYIATVRTLIGLKIYNLPGTIPCDLCGGNLGLAKIEEKKKDIITTPLPNPSSNEVKITFSLPDGANRGELVLYNSEGQKIKSYQVDSRFGFIMLDNSQLPSGMYYYNIVANGITSSTQKMVLVK